MWSGYIYEGFMGGGCMSSSVSGGWKGCNDNHQCFERRHGALSCFYHHRDQSASLFRIPGSCMDGI
jgi:hypothetical protein